MVYLRLHCQSCDNLRWGSRSQVRVQLEACSRKRATDCAYLHASRQKAKLGYWVLKSRKVSCGSYPRPVLNGIMMEACLVHLTARTKVTPKSPLRHETCRWCKAGNFGKSVVVTINLFLPGYGVRFHLRVHIDKTHQHVKYGYCIKILDQMTLTTRQLYMIRITKVPKT